MLICSHEDQKDTQGRGVEKGGASWQLSICLFPIIGLRRGANTFISPKIPPGKERNSVIRREKMMM